MWIWFRYLYSFYCYLRSFTTVIFCFDTSLNSFLGNSHQNLITKTNRIRPKNLRTKKFRSVPFIFPFISEKRLRRIQVRGSNAAIICHRPSVGEKMCRCDLICHRPLGGLGLFLLVSFPSLLDDYFVGVLEFKLSCLNSSTPN